MRHIITTPISWLFALLVGLKNRLYDQGRLRVTRLKQPVISVGNLSMGGTGKTPITADLVARLLALGAKPAVLSRGYGRQNPKSALLVTPETPTEQGGDEPCLIARRHPGAKVLVGPSRAAAANAVAPETFDIAVIDDGFQHRQLHRDVDIVLLDVTRGLPKLFPRGLFREGLSSLERADLVVLTRWDGQDPLTEWIQAIARVDPGLPVVKVRFTASRFVDQNGADVAREVYGDQAIAAYAGIGNPEPFFASLREQGLNLVETLALGDHQPFDAKQSAAFLDRCRKKGVKHVITTEKDMVKLDNPLSPDIIMSFLAIDVLWEDSEQIDQLLRRSLGVV